MNNNYYNNFQKDKEWQEKFAIHKKQSIIDWCRKKQLRIITLLDQNNTEIDTKIGVDYIAKVKTKKDIEILLKFDFKIRRYKYWSYFKNDKKILIEIQDREKTGWGTNEGIIIAYAFSNENEDGFVLEPIFFMLNETTRQIIIDIKADKNEIKESYDNTNFVLVNYAKLENTLNNYIDYLNGEKSLTLRHFIGA